MSEPLSIIGYILTGENFNYGDAEYYKYITHGIIAFLTFNRASRGDLDPSSLAAVTPVIEGAVKAGHSVGTKILISVGGAEDYGFLELMTEIGSNSAHPLLEHAAQNLANFVRERNLDGIDLDLECWWDKHNDPTKDQGGRYLNMEPPEPPAGHEKGKKGPHPAGSALALLAARLRQLIPDKLISATVFGTSWYGNNYDSTLADHVNWLGVMTYDLTGSWDRSPVAPHTALRKLRQEDYKDEQQGSWPRPATGSESQDPMGSNPIASVEECLDYWTKPDYKAWNGDGQTVSPGKIAVGVPLYG